MGAIFSVCIYIVYRWMPSLQALMEKIDERPRKGLLSYSYLTVFQDECLNTSELVRIEIFLCGLAEFLNNVYGYEYFS